MTSPALLVAALLIAAPLQAQIGSSIKADERVVLFDTAAWLDEEAGVWHVPVAGWIFEPEEDSTTREVLMREFADVLDLPEDSIDQEIYRRRARAFFVDNERGKRTPVRVGSGVAARWVRPGRSGRDGHFTGELLLHPADAAGLLAEADRNGGWIPTATQPRRGDGEVFTGQVQVLPPEGGLLISDIDDTIKISEVRDRQALLERTFLRAFEPTPSLASMYRFMATDDTFAIAYVSSSPVQLVEPITAFLEEHDLPRGEMHLRPFRWKDSSFFNLLASSMETKPPVIEALLERWPRRKVVLVGDSGEHDPEIYGEIARAHPDQVFFIMIRDVTGEDPEGERYLKAFADLPDWRCVVLTDADLANAAQMMEYAAERRSVTDPPSSRIQGD
jgi:hypothetical protein